MGVMLAAQNWLDSSSTMTKVKLVIVLWIIKPLLGLIMLSKIAYDAHFRIAKPAAEAGEGSGEGGAERAEENGAAVSEEAGERVEAQRANVLESLSELWKAVCSAAGEAHVGEAAAEVVKRGRR
jgi:hypothetical protein